jgi:tetratricopeptide (TPR) repeat protein
LADDLRRFLEDKPIRARPPSRLERLRRWSRRHRSIIGSAMVALLAALAVLAASVGWVVRDAAARRARTAIEVQSAMDEARRLLREGKWPQGQAAAQRAEALLASREGGDGLCESVQELLADFHMLARLEEVRLFGSTVKDGHFDFEREDAAYSAAFRDYGIDVETLQAGEAVRRIAARMIRVELAAALDGWAQKRREAPQKGWKNWRYLLALARAVDPDPARAALREAVQRGDVRALAQRSASGEVLALPPVTLVLLAAYLGECGRRPEATSLMRRAQERHPGDFWINHTLAFLLVHLSPPRWEEAIPFYTAAVALRPDSAGARINLAHAFAGKGRFDEAIAVYHKAIELKPGYAEAHLGLGNALANKGRLDEAITALREAVALKPHLGDSHYNLGIALVKKGQLDEAMAAYRRAIVLRPRLAQAHNNLGTILLERGRLDESLAALRKAIEIRPDLAVAHSNLGEALARKGRLDEATTSHRRAVALKPEDAMAHCKLGVAYWPQRRLDEAAAEFRRAIELDPREALAHYNLGNIFFERDHLDQAIAAYRRAIDLKDDLAEAYCNLGIALRRQGEFAAAVNALRRGHELGSRRKDWAYPSAEWVRECERLAKMPPSKK